jgi:hypothetical protein
MPTADACHRPTARRSDPRCRYSPGPPPLDRHEKHRECRFVGLRPAYQTKWPPNCGGRASFEVVDPRGATGCLNAVRVAMPRRPWTRTPAVARRRLMPPFSAGALLSALPALLRGDRDHAGEADKLFGILRLTVDQHIVVQVCYARCCRRSQFESAPRFAGRRERRTDADGRIV